MLGKRDNENVSIKILINVINGRKKAVFYFFLYQYSYLDSSPAPRGIS